MRKTNYFIGVLCLLSGQIASPLLANDGQQSAYQFPPANQAAAGDAARAYMSQQAPVAYAYPQVMAQQPAYYGYPVYPGAAPAYYYPQARTVQPMAMMPYGYPQSYPNTLQRYPGMVPGQAAQIPQMAQTSQLNQAQAQAPQYRSPYNPNIAATPGPKPPPPPQPKKEIKPWGDTRYIWPDFYTDFTGDFWDEMINAPYKMGYMPGGWRFPSLSSPDPVTVGDAVVNQVPPILDESANFINFAD
ncbi:MAG: hypothetical protein R3F02_20160 [Thiolinea sp.]